MPRTRWTLLGAYVVAAAIGAGVLAISITHVFEYASGNGAARWQAGIIAAITDVAAAFCAVLIRLYAGQPSVRRPAAAGFTLAVAATLTANVLSSQRVDGRMTAGGVAVALFPPIMFLIVAAVAEALATLTPPRDTAVTPPVSQVSPPAVATTARQGDTRADQRDDSDAPRRDTLQAEPLPAAATATAEPGAAGDSDTPLTPPTVTPPGDSDAPRVTGDSNRPDIAAAEAWIREQLTDGEDVTGRQVAERFGRPTRWGQRRIAAVKSGSQLHAVGGAR